MRNNETTNLLLLLILLVLLIGFGLLAPILWIVGAVVGVWISAIALGAISKKVSAGFEAVGRILDWIFAPIWNATRSLLGNNAVQWCLIAAAAGLLIWNYFDSGKTGYLHALIILALFALFKGISYWNTVSSRRKYRKVDLDDS